MFLVWILIAIVYVVIGVNLVVFAYKKVRSKDERPLITSFVIALFFSFGLAVGHFAVPLPFLPLLFIWVYELLFYSVKLEDGVVTLLIPFLVQWILIAGVFSTVCNIREKLHQRRRQD